MKAPIRVVIADDSQSVRHLLSHYVDGEDDMTVVAAVADGAAALHEVQRLRPDVVTLDIDMPGLDGLTTLEHIMTECPTPTLMISGVGGRSAHRTLEALQSGAVDFVLKYSPRGCDPGTQRREILAKIRSAAGVRTVRTLRHRGELRERGEQPPTEAESFRANAVRPLPTARSRRQRMSIPTANVSAGRVPATGVVVIGASTGGPVALRQLVSELPADFPRPVVVVQHIPRSFTRALAQQLDRHTPLTVGPAEDGATLRSGHIYIAPGNVHLLLTSDGSMHYNLGPTIHGHRPAIDITMQSAARAFGDRACGVLLTGMGVDGADGMRAIHLAGGVTLAQDEASSVVWGMPQRAYQQGSVSRLATPPEIARQLALPSPTAPVGRSLQVVSP